MFDVIHQNFDFRTNNAIRAQSINLRILNAQLISRLGYVSNEIARKKQEVLDAIDERAEIVGNPELGCIQDGVASLENAADYASENLNELMAEVMSAFDHVERDYFYPLMRVLQWESNIIQSSVKVGMHRENPVTHAAALIQRLEDDYYVMVSLYTASITNIAREIDSFDHRMNELKQTMFPRLNSIRDYFNFDANLIKDLLTICNA